MEKITPEQFKQILAKIYAVYVSDYKNNDTDTTRYEHIMIDGITFKVGYAPGQGREPVVIRIVNKGKI